MAAPKPTVLDASSPANQKGNREVTRGLSNRPGSVRPTGSGRMATHHRHRSGSVRQVKKVRSSARWGSAALAKCETGRDGAGVRLVERGRICRQWDRITQSHQRGLQPVLADRATVGRGVKGTGLVAFPVRGQDVAEAERWLIGSRLLAMVVRTLGHNRGDQKDPDHPSAEPIHAAVTHGRRPTSSRRSQRRTSFKKPLIDVKPPSPVFFVLLVAGVRGVGRLQVSHEFGVSSGEVHGHRAIF